MNITRTLRIALLLTAILASGTALAQSYKLDFLATSGNRYWAPADINNHGQIAGVVGESHFPMAVTWDARRPSQITYLPTYADCCTYIASWANAINDRGQVAGDDTYRAALWNGRTRPELLTGEHQTSSAHDLNEAGVVVGTFGGRATRWDATGTHALGTLGGGPSEAYAINESGTVAGMSDSAAPGYDSHATLWQNGNVVDLGAGSAYGLNDHGVAVGVSDQRATLWNGTQATFLGNFGSVAADVNNRGWVVGTHYDELFGDPNTAMLWRDGQSIDLNSFLSQSDRDAGWRLVAATAINEGGWIVGSAFNATSVSYTGFLLSVPAVPEPTSFALMAAGLAVFGAAARRKRLASA